jgi:hypothetical protein
MEATVLDLNHPLIESVLLPLALALALTPSLLWIFGARWGNRLAAASIGLALLVALVLTFGVPAWPARSGMQKLPLILLLLLAGGMVIDIIKPGRIVVALTTIAATVAIALWLGWPQLTSGDTGMLLLLTSASLLALICLYGLVAAQPEGGNRSAMIVLAALGLAGASFNAGSLALFEVALALAAAVGGFALWNWPKPRLPFVATGISVGGLGCFAVALLLLLLTQIRPWMLLPLPLIFAADAVARRLPVPARFRRTTVEPLYIAAISLIPAVMVLLLAQIPTSSDDLYYR